jgi:PAS domain S-box-containing protein
MNAVGAARDQQVFRQAPRPTFARSSTFGLMPRDRVPDRSGRTTDIRSRVAVDRCASAGFADSPSSGRSSSATSAVRVHDVIDRRRIVSVCQPIYSVLERRPVAVEALARFPGTDGPDRWFEDARRVGLGVELELAAVRAALTLLPNVPPELPFGINASPATIHDPRFVDTLRAATPCRLVVELTEHQAVHDYDQLAVDIAALRALGVRIAIDDVGAGFSSFAHVIHLRPDFIKIDMSLVAGVHHDPSRQAVIKAIVAIARTVEAAVTAEGVETVDEMHALIELGVSHMQGFLFARPGPTPLPPFPADIDVLSDVVCRSLNEDEQHHIDQRKFGLVFEHSPIGMAIVALDGHFINVNPSLESILDRTRTDLETQNLLALTDPADAAMGRRLFDGCLQGRRSHYRTYCRFTLPNSSSVLCDLTATLARSRAGQPLYFIVQMVASDAAFSDVAVGATA